MYGIRAVIAVVGFSCIGLFTSATRAADASELVLGQSAPLTGRFDELGIAYRDGARLYFEKTNAAGGVNGHQIRLVTMDDAYDVKKAEANTHELIDKQNVIALFGHMFTNTVFASVKIATAAGVPYVAPYAGNDELYPRPANPILFMTRASYSAELDALMRHIQAMGLTKIALVRYDSVGGKSLANDLTLKMKAVKLVPMGIAVMKLNSEEASEAASQIEKMQPAAVILGVSGADAVAFVRRFHQVNNGQPVQFLARSLIGGHQLVADLSKEGRGIVISQTAPSPFNGQTRVAREYQAALKARPTANKVTASYIGFEGYIAAKVMVEGLRRAGVVPTRKSLAVAMESIKDWDAGNFRINYTPNDHGGSKFVTVTVIGEGGHFIE